MLVREARRQGVQHIVITHAMNPPIEMTIPQMQEAAREGAFIEFAGQSLRSRDAARARPAVCRRDPCRRAGIVHPVERSWPEDHAVADRRIRAVPQCAFGKGIHRRRAGSHGESQPGDAARPDAMTLVNAIYRAGHDGQ